MGDLATAMRGKFTGWYLRGWHFWFRINGYGFAVARDRPRLFSERYGHRRVYRLGRWSFEWLHPEPESP